MNRQKKNILIGTLIVVLLLGGAGAATVYHYFFSRPFQLTETAYIYIDRDDDIDSVYHKITPHSTLHTLPPTLQTIFRYEKK